jgi:cytochrome c oxidase subunit 2
VVSDVLVLPVDKQVLLRLSAIDVIHSFWVPEFRVKQDAVPGIETQLRINPNKIGAYTLMCAELCGRSHAYMTSTVNVTTQTEFDGWVNEQLTYVSDDPLVRGQAWVDRYGCEACHSLDGSPLVGPSFLGIYGRQEILEDDSTVTVDDAYLYESIREPSRRIVQGFPNAMPVNVAESMTDEQIADILAFLKTLK